MILVEENNFLLLKNFEVNGDYIESVLSNSMPDNAIVTPMSNSSYYYKPRNYENLQEYMSFYDINKVHGLANCKAYIIVRNPYHAVFSNFFYSLKTINVLESWPNLKEEEQKEILTGYFYSDFFLKSTKDLYIYDNMLMLEDVIIYEDGVEEQLNQILIKHNLPTVKLNSLEDKYVPKDITFLDIFSKDQINMITENWKWEFDNFGYERFIS